MPGVSEKVGYSSAMMIRAFKRYEGATPGRYREDGSLPGAG